MRLDRARAKYWLGVGAQPSEPVGRLLSMVGFSFFAFLGGGLGFLMGEKWGGDGLNFCGFVRLG